MKCGRCCAIDPNRRLSRSPPCGWWPEYRLAAEAHVPRERSRSLGRTNRSRCSGWGPWAGVDPVSGTLSVGLLHHPRLGNRYWLAGVPGASPQMPRDVRVYLEETYGISGGQAMRADRRDSQGFVQLEQSTGCAPAGELPAESAGLWRFCTAPTTWLTVTFPGRGWVAPAVRPASQLPRRSRQPAHRSWPRANARTPRPQRRRLCPARSRHGGRASRRRPS